jgi:hypothetical protein
VYPHALPRKRIFEEYFRPVIFRASSSLLFRVEFKVRIQLVSTVNKINNLIGRWNRKKTKTNNGICSSFPGRIRPTYRRGDIVRVGSIFMWLSHLVDHSSYGTDLVSATRKPFLYTQSARPTHAARQLYHTKKKYFVARPIVI